MPPLPVRVEELVRLKVDVILPSGGPAALAARKATTSVPIVFVGVVDPVGLGLLPSLGRPGGNLTGLATTSEDFAGKRLELLKAIVPSLKRVAVLWHPANLWHRSLGGRCPSLADYVTEPAAIWGRRPPRRTNVAYAPDWQCYSVARTRSARWDRCGRTVSSGFGG
jgi:ABC transporter substrate binding protein